MDDACACKRCGSPGEPRPLLPDALDNMVLCDACVEACLAREWPCPRCQCEQVGFDQWRDNRMCPCCLSLVRENKESAVYTFVDEILGG